MKIICLPCEIQHREFDSKILLATRIASSTDYGCLIGLDKYFKIILEELGPSVLLDKSMSTIMFNARIEKVKNNNGFVLINDEEGVNDLEVTPSMLQIRCDAQAANIIDAFLSWGEDDSVFYSSHLPQLSEKTIVAGSHRYDLLNSIGKDFYKQEISSINTLFGKFILYNDNLAVDHFRSDYKPPDPHIYFTATKELGVKATKEWNSIGKEHASRRNKVAEIIMKLSHIGYNIIIRPHPVYDSLFWHQMFRKSPNVTVLYNNNVEPWLHAATAVLTTGCSTGLQALLASTPSYELFPGDSNAFSSRLLPKFDMNTSLSIDAIQNYSEMRSKLTSKIQKRWFHKGSTTQYFSKLICDYASKLVSHSNIESLNNISDINTGFPKWRGINLFQFQKRVVRFQKILNTSTNIKCSQVANGLFLMSKT